MNLQLKYDKELLEFEEINSITKEEHQIVKKLTEIVSWFKSNCLISVESFATSLVLDLRKILGVSNLVDIKTFTYSGAFRAQTKKMLTQIYFLLGKKFVNFLPIVHKFKIVHKKNKIKIY